MSANPLKIQEMTGKQRWKQIITLCLLIVIVGFSHATTPVLSSSHFVHTLHVILRKLFLVPILLGAIWFEMRGAIIVAAIVSVVYLPHIFVQWAGYTSENVNQVGEIATYWVTALVAGVFVKIEKNALRDVATTHEGSLIALSAALDVREHDTELHSLRVREYALRIGRELGLDDEQMRTLGQAALLHDIGKIGTPDNILLKPGALTDKEWEIIHQHPETGLRILTSVPFLKNAAKIVYCHHERYDGSGYPQGLRAEQIPILSRVFAVADVFDALTSERPYRRKLSYDDAKTEITKESGKLLDPKIVDSFLRIPSSQWSKIEERIAERAIYIAGRTI